MSPQRLSLEAVHHRLDAQEKDLNMLRTMTCIAGPLLGVGLLALPPAAMARELVVTRLVPTVSGFSDAEGDVELEVRRRATDFDVDIEGVPDGSYRVVIDSVQRGVITVRNGEGELDFSTRPDRDERRLDFNVIGVTVAIYDGQTRILEGMTPGSGAGGGVQVDMPRQRLKESMSMLDPTQPHRARVLVDLRSNPKKAELRVRANRLTPGVYALVVNGEPVAMLSTNHRGRINERFSTDGNRNSRPLDFDPARSMIELVRSGSGLAVSRAMLGGQPLGIGGSVGGEQQDGSWLPGGVVDATQAPQGTSHRQLENTGVARRGEGVAVVTNDWGEVNFWVEIEDVPLGTYTLRVDGSDVGSFQVVNLPGDREGEIEFSTDPDEPNDRLLTFDPWGATLEVVRDGVVYFTGRME
ncbi:MAG: hypothetical protein Tsb0013_10680 [Phycisphaerales bacterium]